MESISSRGHTRVALPAAMGQGVRDESIREGHQVEWLARIRRLRAECFATGGSPPSPTLVGMFRARARVPRVRPGEASCHSAWAAASREATANWPHLRWTSIWKGLSMAPKRAAHTLSIPAASEKANQRSALETRTEAGESAEH